MGSFGRVRVSNMVGIMDSVWCFEFMVSCVGSCSWLVFLFVCVVFYFGILEVGKMLVVRLIVL